MPYAEKHADYYADDYNYSSDDYPNGDGDDTFSNHLGENEKVIHVTPVMKSKNSDKYTNEGDLIKLPCVVDNLGKFLFLTTNFYGYPIKYLRILNTCYCLKINYIVNLSFLEGHVLMWQKGDKILSLGNNLMKKENQMFISFLSYGLYCINIQCFLLYILQHYITLFIHIG